MAKKYAITCARLTELEGLKEIRDRQDMGETLENQVNDLADQGYYPIDITSGQDIACVIMKK